MPEAKKIFKFKLKMLKKEIIIKMNYWGFQLKIMKCLKFLDNFVYLLAYIVR